MQYILYYKIIIIIFINLYQRFFPIFSFSFTGSVYALFSLAWNSTWNVLRKWRDGCVCRETACGYYRARGEALVVGAAGGRCPPDVVARGSTGRRSFLVVRIQREFRSLRRDRRLKKISTNALAKLLQQRRPFADHVTARSSGPRSQTRRRRLGVPIVVVTLLLELVVLIQAAHRAESSQNSEITEQQRSNIVITSSFLACSSLILFVLYKALYYTRCFLWTHFESWLYA